MLYLYFILSIVIVLIAARCLRSHFDSYIPVLTLSFLISMILTTIINIIVFFNTGEKTYFSEAKTYAVEIVKKDSVFHAIDYGKYKTNDKDYIIKKSDGKNSYLIITHYYQGNKLFPKYVNIEDSVVKVVNLNKKDYEIYKSFKTNAD